MNTTPAAAPADKPAPQFVPARDLPAHLQSRVPNSWMTQPLALLRSTDDEGRGTGPGPGVEVFAAGNGDRRAIQRVGTTLEQAIEGTVARAQQGDSGGAHAVLQAKDGSAFFSVGLQSVSRPNDKPLPELRDAFLSYDTEAAKLHEDLRAIVGSSRVVTFDA